MSKKRIEASGVEPRGSKHSLIQEWVENVARSFGGSVRTTTRGPIIHVASQSWRDRGLPAEPTLIAYEPEPSEWSVRTKVLNKLAARVLVSDPIYFAAEFDGPRVSVAQTKHLDVLRCSVERSMASSPFKSWRSTFYHVRPSNRVFAIDGDDGLLSSSQLVEKNWDFEPSLEERLDCILKAIRQQEAAIQSNVITEVVEGPQQRLELQIKELEGFYFGGSPGIVELHGVEDPAISKEQAVEAEYRTRLASIIRKHTLVILTRILSIGRIYCRPDGRAGTLPFVKTPLSELTLA